MKNTYYILIITLIAAFLFFFGLGNMALTDPDESFYAQSAREMLVSGDWTTPRIFGSPQFEKPVLYYWLVILSYVFLGITEFSARFSSAVFAVAGVIGIYLLGRLMFSRLCGYLSGLILATSALYLVLGRACVTDMVLTVFILYSLLFFLYAWEKHGRGYYILASIMAALAVLTKGPVGLFIPGAIVLLYILLNRQWKRLREVPIFWCIVVFLAVSVPWYVAVSRVHGSTFIGEFFGFQNITRFLHPEHRIGSSPFFYIPIVLGGVFPWTTFMVAGAWDMYKRRDDTSLTGGYRSFLLIWFLVVFIFFSASRTKLVTYILPLFPVLALVAGRFWERVVTLGKDDKRLEKYMKISYFAFIFISLGALIGFYFLMRHEYPIVGSGTILASIFFSLGLILSIFFFRERKTINSFMAIILAVILMSYPLVSYVLPVVGELESSRPLATIVKWIVEPGVPLGGEDDHRRGIAFYADRTDVENIHRFGDLLGFISRDERVWCVIQRKHYEQMKRERGEDLLSQPIGESGKYVLVTNNR
ncbi:MAG: glycosyltransferase family 39 protein [Candidatus Omnitrophica bacterium]|nr:glycosyltransferase family 39 protein [Candidatus Omnitrophota bacterium]